MAERLHELEPAGLQLTRNLRLASVSPIEVAQGTHCTAHVSKPLWLLLLRRTVALGSLTIEGMLLRIENWLNDQAMCRINAQCTHIERMVSPNHPETAINKRVTTINEFFILRTYTPYRKGICELTLVIDSLGKNWVGGTPTSLWQYPGLQGLSGNVLWGYTTSKYNSGHNNDKQ